MISHEVAAFPHLARELVVIEFGVQSAVPAVQPGLGRLEVGRVEKVNTPLPPSDKTA